MSNHNLQPESICISTKIEPLVMELHERIQLIRVDRADARRADLEGFIQSVFHRAYRARIATFLPRLVGFVGPSSLRAVAGYRDGGVRPLFSEAYLDEPAERLISQRFGRRVRREQLVEVGNLALSHPGQARWVIAALTAYLRAAGYRWVVFTAVTPVVNAFRRLGLRPLPLAAADARRLPDQGGTWGSYYAGNPVVYAGDIEAGLAKLTACASLRQPQLAALLSRARRAGVAAFHDAHPAGAPGRAAP